MNQYLDHVIWVCSDLGHGMHQFEAITGVGARFGGVHASGLTHNALVTLGPGCYLEILAPTSPAGDADDDWCRLARRATQPRLLTYCMRAPLSLANLAGRAHSLGFSEAEVAANARTTPTGVNLRWQWVQPRLDRFGLAFPFFIDWLDSPHPAQPMGEVSLDDGITVKRFAVGHPQCAELGHVLMQLGTPVETYAVPATEFQLRLDTPRGTVSL